LTVSPFPASTGGVRALLSVNNRPNIIFIMSDDHAYHALSCYGSKINTTLNLDRIAAGMVGKWHLGSDPTGFDHWIILPGQGAYVNPSFLTAAGPTELGCAAGLRSADPAAERQRSPGSHRRVRDLRDTWGHQRHPQDVRARRPGLAAAPASAPDREPG